MNLKKGFTLIELLVVIAIIGILSSVVLASLNSARSKGIDTAIKGNLANLRAQAEIYYDNAGNYGTTIAAAAASSTTVCNWASTVFAPSATNSINAGILAALQAGGSATTATCAIGGTTGNAQSWAVSVSRGSGQQTWCVDSAGSSKSGAATGGNTNAAVCS